MLPASAATILVFGDSLSAAYGLSPEQGWVALLAKQLGAQHKVINASISGETSAGGLARLPEALKRHQPNIVILELGANDGLRGLPLKEMQNNLQTMIELSKRSQAKVLLVGMGLPPNYGPDYGKAFRQAYVELAKKNKLSLVPLLVAGFEADLNQFQADGLHPKASAQARMMRTVASKLAPLLK
ncbi:arylesterase [Neisseriaceae bacterium TC5R-5]|nr:arylesterase [Neisseriaceae bacterium TC5R-5]